MGNGITTVLGESSSSVTVGKDVTVTKFESAGATTVIDKDSDGNVIAISTIQSVGRDIVIVTKADGYVEYFITQNGKTSKIVSNLKGTQTVVKVNGDIEIIAGKYDTQDNYFIKIKLIIKVDGTSEVRLIKINKDNMTDISDVTKEMIFGVGTEFEIFERDGLPYIKSIVSLNKIIVVK